MRTTLLTTLLLAGAAFAASPSAEKSLAGFQPEARFEAQSTGSALTVRFDIDQTDLSKLTRAAETPGLDSEPDPVLRWAIIPNQGSVKLNFRSVDATRFVEDQNQITRSEVSLPEAGKLVRIGTPQIMRGVRLVPISTTPFFRNADGSTIVAKSIEFELEFTSERGVHEVTNPAPLNEDYEQLLGSVVINPPRGGLPGRDPAATDGGRMLLLYPEGLDNYDAASARLEDFIEWKEKQGIAVTPRSVDGGGTTAEDIKEEIIRPGDDNGNLWDYVLIVGWFYADTLLTLNEDLLFPAYLHPDEENASYPGDFLYVTLDDDEERDWLPDIRIGRIMAHTPESLIAILNRTMGYEQSPFMDEVGWFTHAMHASDHADLVDGLKPVDYELGNWVERTLGLIGVNTETIYGLFEETIEREREIFVQGVTFATADGYFSGMHDRVEEEEVEWAHTGRKNPFLVSQGTWYDYPFLHLFYNVGTADVPEGPIGALAIHSWNNGTTYQLIRPMIGGTVRAMTYGGTNRTGDLMMAATAMMAGQMVIANGEDGPLNDLYRDLSKTILLGDPSLNIYTAVPGTITSDLPRSLNPGATFLSFRLLDRGGAGIPGVTVCVRQLGNNFFRYVDVSDQNGTVSFSVPEGLDEGEFSIVASKKNFRPLIITQAVEYPEVNLTVTGFEIDPAQLINGSNSALSLAFFNDGEANAEQIVARFTANSPHLTFSRNSARVDDMESNADGSLAEEVRLQLASSAPGLDTIRVQIAITAAGDFTFPASFEVVTSGPRYFVPEEEVVYANFVPGAQQATVAPRLRNNGDRNGIALTASLRSLTPGIVVTQIDRNYGAVARGGVSAPDAPFQVTIADLFVPGQRANFELRLRGNGGVDVTIPFSTIVSSPDSADPVGPDPYGYYAFDSGDTARWPGDTVGWPEAPNYDWIEINPDATDPQAEFAGTRVDLDDQGNSGASTLIDLPFTFTYYGEEFDRLVICSNGWVSFDTTAIGFISPMNRPIPGYAAPNGQLAIYWQDLMNPNVLFAGFFTHYDEAGGRFIIEWSDLDLGEGNIINCQIILLDPEVYPSETDDGEFLFQYKNYIHFRGSVDPHFFATVGIRSPNGEYGLQYSHAGHYNAAAHEISDSFAIKFTTSIANDRGTVIGRFVEAADSTHNLEGVHIFHPREFEMISAADGRFQAELRAGHYENVVAKLDQFNDKVFSFDIRPGQETRLQRIGMTQPKLENYPHEVNVSLRPDLPGRVGVHFSNTGNGEMEYRTRTLFPDGSDAAFRLIDSVNVSRTLDVTLNGPTCVDTLIFIPRQTGKTIVVFDSRLHHIDSLTFNQPQQARQSSKGLRNLTWDGEKFWGAFNPNPNDQEDPEIWKIIAFNRAGQTLSSFDAPEPFDASTSILQIAYAPERGTLFAVRVGTDICEISHQEDQLEVINRWPIHFPGEIFEPTGMVWNSKDDEGKSLYILDRKFTGAFPTRTQRMVKFSPETGEFSIYGQIPNFISAQTARPAVGFGLMTKYSSDTLMMVCLEKPVTQANADRLHMIALGPNLSFLDGHLRRGAGTVAPGAVGAFVIPFDATGVDTGFYRFSVRLITNGPDVVNIPVTLQVTEEGSVSDETPVPLEFGITSLHPNPFNAMLGVEFLAPKGQHAVMKVYDLAGREVATLFDGVSPGRTKMFWNGENAAAGLYLVRLEAENGRVMTRKVALVK